MPEEKDLDQLIDAALTTYAGPECDSELAGRILNRIAGEPASSPHLRWLPWAIALPAAICLLLLVHPARRATRPGTRRGNQAAQVHNPAVSTVRTTSSPTVRATETRPTKPFARHPRLAAAAAPQPLPKLDVFPTPQPLTPQERALAVSVAHMPQAEQQSLAHPEQEPVPLTVASIPVMSAESIPVMSAASLPIMHFEPPDEGAN